MQTKWKSVSFFLCSSLRNTNLSYLTSYPPNKISAKYFFEHVDKQKSHFDSNSFLKSQKQKFKTTIKYVSQQCKFLYIWIDSNIAFLGPSIIKEHKFTTTIQKCIAFLIYVPVILI